MGDDGSPSTEPKRGTSDAVPASGTPVPTGIARRRGIKVLAVIVAVCLPLTVAGWLGVRGWQAASHLDRAATLLVRIQGQIDSHDPAARQTLVALRRETSAARAETGGPAWRVGAHLPWLGADFTAVRTVAAVVDDLVQRALPPLVDVASGGAGGLAPRDGRVDLPALITLASRLDVAVATIGAADRAVAAISMTGLTPTVRSAVGRLAGTLRTAVAATAPVGRIARLLPAMFGADGPRTYLVLFQNLAEVRATGGMPGAYVVVGVEGGAIRIVDQGSAAANLKTFSSPVLASDPAMTAIYGDRPGMFPADVNLSPDFPSAAALAREMYRRRTGRTVDGVLATDPVALSYLLNATGPVRMPTGVPLAAPDAVRLLLSQVYASMTSDQSKDRYLAGAARAVFEALVGGQGDPRAIVAELARGVGQRRILLWSAHPDEERAIAGTMLEGRLPANDGGVPTVGVFLNDGSGAKLDYYLAHQVTLTVGGCRPDGRREIRLRVTLRSDAPRAGLPAYVLGLGLSGDPYTVRTNVMIFSPTGGGIVAAQLNGAAVALGTGTERGRAVGVITVDLRPGASGTLTIAMVTDVLMDGRARVEPRLWVTPGVAPWPTRIQSATGCNE